MSGSPAARGGRMLLCGTERLPKFVACGRSVGQARGKMYAGEGRLGAFFGCSPLEASCSVVARGAVGDGIQKLGRKRWPRDTLALTDQAFERCFQPPAVRRASPLAASVDAYSYGRNDIWFRSSPLTNFLGDWRRGNEDLQGPLAGHYCGHNRGF